MILAGFRAPMSIYLGRAQDRNVLYVFFQELSAYLEKKEIKNRKLITDRLYRRYVHFVDVEETFKLMKQIENDFILENSLERERYRVLFETFYDAANQVKYLIEIGRKEEDENRLQTGLLELPYELEEHVLPNEYYDDLPDDAEPVWMRTEALDIEGILEKYRTKK